MSIDAIRFPFARLRRLAGGRGGTPAAGPGWAIGAILVVAMVACGYWSFRSHQQTVVYSRSEQARGVVGVLAASCEGLLSDGELEDARRLLAESTAQHGFIQYALQTAAGDVLAAADPARISADLETASLAPTPAAGSVEVSGGTVSVRHPVRVIGRGHAVLVATLPLHPAGADAWRAQAGVGAISGGALVALLLVYRRFHGRMQALGAIRAALLELHRGPTPDAALLVAGDLGVEAEAWNQVIGEQQRLRRLAAVQELKHQVSAAPGADSDLASGCDAMTQGLVMLDDALRVRYANNAAALFLRLGRDALQDASIDQVMGDADLLAVIRSAVQSGKRATHLIDRRGSGENAGVMRFSVRPVRRGDASTAMVVIEDVTQQRVAEEARHDFVAHATHELRTPLTNIRLYLETLLEDGEDDVELRAKCLNVINQETRRLERMVGDMLSVAEIEAGSIKIERDDVRVEELLADVEKDYAAAAEEKSIALIFKLPPKLPMLQADRDKLALALQNVVGNALKYTNDGGRVSVAAEVDRSLLRIEVNDTGIGIAEADLPRVFEKFYRAQDRRVAQVTGSGLGLALAREIVRLHGGDITAESQVDHGSTFTITLPVGGDGRSA